MTPRLPVIVLGGSDHRPGPVPRGLQPDDMLTGYKGALRLPRGTTLIGELVGRLRQSGRFEDPILIGPHRVYDGLADCEVFDVDGNLAMTLQRTEELIRSRFEISSPIAFTTCDILPTADEFQRLMAEAYDPHTACHFWSQLVRAEPDQLGASHWKPAYRFRPAAGQPLVNLYPGHFVIARPAAVRMSITNHLLRLAYSHRNVELHKRRLRMILRGSGRLIAEDLRNLLLLKAPLLTIGIPFYCLRAYAKYRRAQLTVPDFAHYVGRVFLHRDYHHVGHGQPVVFAVTEIISLAKDIDTRAELAEIGAI